MCEDYPCCGHDICPDFDESGKQLNMRCTCGARLPLGNRYSLCETCLRDPDDDRDFDPRDDEDEDYSDEDNDDHDTFSVNEDAICDGYNEE